MTSNRSLDEFVDGEEAGEPSTDAAGSAAEAGARTEATGGTTSGPVAAAEQTDATPTAADGTVSDGSPAVAVTPDPHEVEPLAETVAWSPTGGACAACGEPAEERWRDGDALVCGDCKEW